MESSTQATSLCRTCLVLLPCDDNAAQCWHNLILERELAGRYVECTLLTLDVTDEFPKCICDSCYEMLLKVDAFQRMCAESLLNFRTYLDERLQILQKETEMCKIEAEVKTHDDDDADDDDEVAATVPVDVADHAVQEQKCVESDVAIITGETITEREESARENFDKAAEAVTVKLEEVYVVSSTTRAAEFLLNREEEISTPTPIPAPAPAPPTPVALIAAASTPQPQPQLEPQLPTPISNDIPPVFHCEYCPTRWFYTEKTFIAHKRTHYGLKPYFCQICCKQFGRISSLQMHTREMHLEEKSFYHCSYDGCQRKYNAVRSLRHHISQVHLQLKTREMHICEKCGKKFDRQTLLTRHRYTHIDKSQYPYACDYCQKRFWCKTFLRDHVNRHVAVKLHVCPVCKVRKVTKGELQYHMKRHEIR